LVFCIIGLAIFGVLGIFSTKYRRYFRESLHCMKRQVTFRPCDTQFDHEMKSKIAASAGKKSERLGRFIYKRFALLSWIMIIMLVASIALIGLGVYNYFAFGNCNGPNSSDFCIFGVLGGNPEERIASLKTIDTRNGIEAGSPNAPVKIIEVGCFSCPYTKSAESLRLQILEKYGGNVSFVFKDMPLPSHNLSRELAEAAKCANEQNAYWEYHDKLFEQQENMTEQKMKDIAAGIGMNASQFNSCLDSRKYAAEVEQDYQDGVAAGIFATPTYFVNGKSVIGLRAFAELEKIVAGEITGQCPDA